MLAAPELKISKWLNTNEPLSLEKLKGRVIAIHAFQMLCPGCVLHGIPQAQKLHAVFNPEIVSVIGLHTVFEHHEAMQEVSLQAFLSEFRVNFPVGIDAPSLNGRIPQTMDLYKMQGTPTWLLIDTYGNLRFQGFGGIEDMSLAAKVTELIKENNKDNKPILRTNNEGKNR
jgi:hypothetical protein